MDKALLTYKINKKGVLIKDLLMKLKISKSAWYKKNNGISEFNRGEIDILIEELDLSSEDVMSIFFTT